MEMKDFYYFRCKQLSNSFKVNPINLGEEGDGIHHQDNLIEAQYEEIEFPVIYKQVSGKKFTDILSTGVPNLLLISDRLKTLLEENFFTGWITYPIIVKDKSDNQINGYHGFSVTGVSGRQSYENSPIIETRYIPEGPIVRLYKGITVDLSKWDGSDFFIPEGTTGIIILKKVAQTLEKKRISNLNLVNLSEVIMDVDMWEKTEKWTNEKRKSV